MKIKKLMYVKMENGDIHFLYVKNHRLYEYEHDCSKTVITNKSFEIANKSVNDIEDCDDYIPFLYNSIIENSLMCCVHKSNIYMLSYSYDDILVILSIFNDDEQKFNEIISIDKNKLKEKEDYNIVKEIIKRFL